MIAASYARKSTDQNEVDEIAASDWRST